MQKVKTKRKNWEKLCAFLPMIDKIGSIFGDFWGFKFQNFPGDHAPGPPYNSRTFRPRSFAPTTHKLAVPIQKMLCGPWLSPTLSNSPDSHKLSQSLMNSHKLSWTLTDTRELSSTVTKSPIHVISDRLPRTITGMSMSTSVCRMRSISGRTTQPWLKTNVLPVCL